MEFILPEEINEMPVEEDKVYDLIIMGQVLRV